jgi:ABC-type Fe3+/spermidine/putrescine transport system ATPase subunit
VLVIEQGRVLQAGPVDEVFARPATLRVAELLGLHNVGEGIVRAPGEIETLKGLRLPCRDVSLAAGTRVMWRVSPRALRTTHDGAWTGAPAGHALRHGDRYVTIEIGNEAFDVAAEDAPRTTEGVQRFSIDRDGVTAWAMANS